MMGDVIEGLIQILGYLTLQVATLGRYGRARPEDALLLEGTVGFGLVAVTMFGIYRVIS